MVLAAGLIAGASFMISEVLRVRLSAGASALGDVPPPPQRQRVDRLTLDLSGFVPPVAEPAQPKQPSPAGGEVRISSLPLDLVGTFMARPDSMSLAVLAKRPGQELRVVRMGEIWEGVQLASVERFRVKVRNTGSGQFEYIVNSNMIDHPGLERAAASPDDATPGALVISRAAINRMIGNNTTKILQWAEMTPHIQGGEMNGVKIGLIKPGGRAFFSRLGFKEGDVVMRVNGVKIDSIERVPQLWKDLHGQPVVNFTVLRDGVVKEHVVKFKD